MSQTAIDCTSGNTFFFFAVLPKLNGKKEQKRETRTDLAILLFSLIVNDTCNHVNHVKTLQQQRKCTAYMWIVYV